MRIVVAVIAGLFVAACAQTNQESVSPAAQPVVLKAGGNTATLYPKMEGTWQDTPTSGQVKVTVSEKTAKNKAKGTVAFPGANSGCPNAMPATMTLTEKGKLEIYTPACNGGSTLYLKREGDSWGGRADWNIASGSISGLTKVGS